MANTLRLVIPGLLEPWRAQSEAGFPRPHPAALERLLARATVQEVAAAGAEATLFHLFGLAAGDARELPVAAVTRLADAGMDAADGWWLRADPVHLHADLHQVLMFRLQGADVSDAEAQALVAELNRAFGGEGWRLDAPHPVRWYLHLADDPGLRTPPLLDAVGQDIRPSLPQGACGRRWNALLTEIQMALHGAEINREREARDRPAVNGLWLWGGGRLPREAHSPAEGVYANDPLTRGLARLAGVGVSLLPDGADEWRAAAADEGEGLVVLEQLRDDRANDAPQVWAGHVDALDQDWFAPGLEMLGQGGLGSLHLYPCDGRVFELSAWHRWRLWRRTRPLLRYLT